MLFCYMLLKVFKNLLEVMFHPLHTSVTLFIQVSVSQTKLSCLGGIYLVCISLPSNNNPVEYALLSSWNKFSVENFATICIQMTSSVILCLLLLQAEAYSVNHFHYQSCLSNLSNTHAFLL
jgi:hypothetical protein